MIEPILERTFTGEGFAPILTSGNTDAGGNWGPALCAGEKPFGRGSFVLCLLKLAGRTRHNPAAARFARRMLDPGDR